MPAKPLGVSGVSWGRSMRSGPPHRVGEPRRPRTLARRPRRAESRSEQTREDEALARARAAGGPIDRACYGCQCGYQFSAAVSTSVVCPHCGSTQAW